MSEFDRVRWHCRRGLLELDIILSRFLDTEYAHLDEAQRAAFTGLLELADNDLWDLVSGRAACADSAAEDVLERLRKA